MIKEVNYATYAIDSADNFRIVSIDKGFTELTGFEEADVFGENMTQRSIIPADCWEEYQAAVFEAMQASGAGYLEHPILKKDGSSIVVFCFGKLRNDGTAISDILITDVTSHIAAQNTIRQQEKEKRLLLQKLSFISENEQEYLIDYNCKTDHFDITIIKDGEARVIYAVDNYKSHLPDIPTIHPDDREIYAQILLAAPGKTEKQRFEFRTSLFDHTYCWFRATYSSYFDKKTEETHIIGRLVNIDREIQNNQKLKKQAEIDTLTSLFNQGTCRSKIDDLALATTDGHTNALIILDIDNFKDINDTFGHISGDKVLEHMGKILKASTDASSSLPGRLGGDEFVIFLRDIPSREYVRQYCENLCTEIRKPLKTSQFTIHTTASLGVVIQDNGPDSFDHLYKCADEALYKQKYATKDGFCFY